jgi:hypothetical protein
MATEHHVSSAMRLQHANAKTDGRRQSRRHSCVDNTSGGWQNPTLAPHVTYFGDAQPLVCTRHDTHDNIHNHAFSIMRAPHGMHGQPPHERVGRLRRHTPPPQRLHNAAPHTHTAARTRDAADVPWDRARSARSQGSEGLRRSHTRRETTACLSLLQRLARLAPALWTMVRPHCCAAALEFLPLFRLLLLAVAAVLVCRLCWLRRSPLLR